jgi:hypothetical protein
MLSFVVEAKNAREKNVSNGGRKYLVISKWSKGVNIYNGYEILKKGMDPLWKF